MAVNFGEIISVAFPWVGVGSISRNKFYYILNPGNIPLQPTFNLRLCFFRYSRVGPNNGPGRLFDDADGPGQLNADTTAVCIEDERIPYGFEMKPLAFIVLVFSAVNGITVRQAASCWFFASRKGGSRKKENPHAHPQ